MKPTQRKDALRNIKKQIISFLSIVLVLALGVAIFLACHGASQALAEKVDEFYDNANFRDLEILSAAGITKEDVEAVKSVDGVSDVEGIFSINMLVMSTTSFAQVKVTSKTERINQVTVLEGRLPETRGECAIVPGLASKLELKVGDIVSIASLTNQEHYLKDLELQVTGIIRHPDNFHRSDIATMNLLIAPEEVDTERLTVPYTSILVRTETEGLQTYSAEYKKKVKEVQALITPLGKELDDKRHEEIVADATAKIEDGEKELEKGKAELEDGQKELAEKESELESGKQQIADGEKELDDAKKKAESSEKELADGKAQLENGRAQLNAAEAQLSDARAKLDKAKAELESGERKLKKAEKKLEAGKKELDDSQAVLEKGKKKLEKARKSLDTIEAEIENYLGEINSLIAQNWNDKWGPVAQLTSIRAVTGNYTLYADDVLSNIATELDLSRKQVKKVIPSSYWDAFAAEYNRLPQGEADYANGLEEYETGLQKWNNGKVEYKTSLLQYEQGQRDYNAALAEYQQGEAEYAANYEQYRQKLEEFYASEAQLGTAEEEINSAKQQITEGEETLKKKKEEAADGEKKIEEGKADLEKAQQEYEDGELELYNAKMKMEDLRASDWVIATRKVNPVWDGAYGTCNVFSNIGITFSLLFILLGVLVCYTTISRLINEERTLVGTTKALGFTRREILAKYMVFGLSSALLGVLMGVLINLFVLQSLMLSSTTKVFLLGSIPSKILPLPTILCFLAAILIAVLATLAACYGMLKKPAVKLLNPEPYKNRFKKKENSARPKSLYASMLARNIFSDLRRVIITIASIAGCCILLIIGFSMKQSYLDLIRRQFDNIVQYDMLVTGLGKGFGIASEVYYVVTEGDDEYLEIHLINTIANTGNESETVQIICADPKEMQDFFNLNDRDTQQKLLVPESGIVITSTYAETYNLSVGDTILFLDEVGNPKEVPVSAIYQNYAGRFLFLPIDYAEELLGQQLLTNTYLIRCTNSNLEQLESKIRALKADVSYTMTEDLRQLYIDDSKIMDFVIIICIILASIMAAVVLFNLVKIQFFQKKKELTIMRINGFSTGQTVMYLLRENIITTIIGMILGLIIGFFAARITLHTMDSVDLQMIRDIMPEPLIYALVITLIFSAIVNWVVLRKVKHLNLYDVNNK